MKFLVKLTVLVLSKILISDSEGYRIFGVFPLPVKSHDIFCQSVMTTLAKRGHHVDVIVARELENPPENYTTIFNIVDLMPFKGFDFSLEDLNSNYIKDIVKYVTHYYGNTVCEILANEKMQEILQNLKKRHNYDIFVTQAFATNCFMGLAHFLKIPMITLSPQILYPWVEDAIGNPSSAAIHPIILSPLTEINSFWDRLENTITKLYSLHKFHYYTETIQNEIVKKYLGNDIPSVGELSRTSVLTLMNTHFSLNGIRPSTPALIEVGGLHISQDETHLTPEIQKWMDESTDGVVYFTTGTTVAIELFPKETILTFFSSFEKLNPVRFLMRVKNVTKLPSGAPENVKMLPWIPQIPVLGHKNTKAFISHCGLFSSQEALYFGVPVIGIPVFLDQFLNLHNLKTKNMAIQLNLKSISETNLVEAVTRILKNSLYREAAKRASNIFKDRPMNAEDTAVYWVEYVIRNGGILKSPAVDFHWIQRELLDVYGFLLLSTILILYLITKIIKTIVIFKFKNKPARKKEKNN